jgi:spermidine synthase
MSLSKLARRFKPAKQGTVEIDRVTVTKMDALMSMIHGCSAYEGTYARLRINGEVVMSDTQMEHRTNSEFLYRAHGHVLLAGLGLGMVLQGLENNMGRIQSITVVEINSDVIDLVAKHYKHPKIKIVQGDITTWTPPEGMKYDVIYFDIWSVISEDNLKFMAQLGRRFAKYKNRNNPKVWMESWSRPQMRANARSSFRAFY